MKAVVIVALTACTSPNVGLASMQDLEPVITINNDGPGSTAASIVLVYSRPPVASPSDCAVLLPSFTATVNNAPLRVIDPGGFDDDDRRCYDIQLAPVHVQPAADTTVVIGDETLTLEVDAGDIAETVDAELVNDSDWAFHPGETVLVRWTPESDLGDAPRAVFGPVGWSVYVERVSGILAIHAPVPAVGDPPITDVKIEFDAQQMSRTVPCGRSNECLLDETFAYQTFQHAVTVQ